MSIQENTFEYVICEMTAILSRLQCVINKLQYFGDWESYLKSYDIFCDQIDKTVDVKAIIAILQHDYAF